MDNEKISVNINDDKLSAIDLLIDEGLVSNRSAFINEAVDLLIQKNQKTIDAILTKRHETVSPNQWFIGLQSLDANYLMQFKEQGTKLSLKVDGESHKRYLRTIRAAEIERSMICCFFYFLRPKGLLSKKRTNQ